MFLLKENFEFQESPPERSIFSPALMTRRRNSSITLSSSVPELPDEHVMESLYGKIIKTKRRSSNVDVIYSSTYTGELPVPLLKRLFTLSHHFNPSHYQKALQTLASKFELFKNRISLTLVELKKETMESHNLENDIQLFRLKQ